MEKNLNETKIIELFESDFNAKSVLYSDSVELSNGFPEEVIANIIKCTIRGSVAYVKEIENTYFLIGKVEMTPIFSLKITLNRLNG